MNPWSPLTTLLATPPTTIALWAGLPCVTLAGMWPDGPWEGLYVIVDASLNALVAVTRWSAALPGAMPTVGAPSPWVVLMWPALFLPLSDAKDIALRVVAGGLLLALW